MQVVTKEDLQYLKDIALKAKKASQQLRILTGEKKNNILKKLADFIDKARSEIKQANTLDLQAANENKLSTALVERLTLDDKGIDSIITSLYEIIALKDPVGEMIDGYTLPNGLNLQKVRIPIGVVAIIFESRPNVTVDVGALGLKSGNAVILRGGKEAIYSNQQLAGLFAKALQSEGVTVPAIQLLERTERHLIAELVRLKDEIDIIVPRGGHPLISYVSEHSLIPVIKHDKGVCHVYIHSSAEADLAEKVLLNAKTQRPGVCNAAETLVIEKQWPQSARMIKALVKAGVIVRGDGPTIEWAKAVCPEVTIEPLLEEGYHQEYLALEMSIKAVDGLNEAIEHILKYNSAHSEAILADDFAAISSFTAALDSSAVFVNCSTRFNDGGQFGLGAEVGIATGKLHVRGPMGLKDLTTYQYLVYGNGQIRG